MPLRRSLLALTLLAAACSTGAPAETVAPTTSLLPAATSTTSTSTTSTSTTTSTTTTTTLPPATVGEDARAVVLAGLPGTALDSATADLLAGGGRGIILYAKNLVDTDQVAELTSAIACAAGAPVIVAVDQEPGRIHRLDAIGIPAPEIGDDAATFAVTATTMAEAMRAIGINLDLAPIVDVAQGSNPVLAGRSLGPDTDIVIERATQFIHALKTAGVGSTAKHFPGHGLSRVDPHREVTYIDAAVTTLEAEHFPPFAAAVDAGVSAVMIGHPIYSALDPDNPASLSPIVLDILRDDFGFDGVAMTDGFSMAALRKLRTLDQLTIDALVAGEDMLLVDRPEDVPQVVAAIVAAVEKGELDRRSLAEAAERVRLLANSLAPVACVESG